MIIGYKRMCAFWFSGFLRVPLLQDYRYLLRLDDDSCILGKINFDVFQHLKSRNIHYAYREIGLDPKDVVVGLGDFVDHYVKGKAINITHPTVYPKVLKKGASSDNMPTFDTNIEIIDMKRFLERDIAEFAHWVDTSKMIFHRRWGDAPLRLVEAMVFLDEDKVMRLCDFDYQHSSWDISRRCRRGSKSKRALHEHINS